MKKLITILSIISILLVAGCITQSQESKIIGNQTLLVELARLQDLSRENQTTVQMLEDLKKKLEGDHFAEDLANEAAWLVRFGEWEHSEHSLSFLTTYLKDGTELICPGHEIEHIDLYVKHDNFELMDHTIESVEEHYPEWKRTAYERRERFPAFYRNLDNVTRMIEEVMPRIKAGDYNISEEIEFLIANEVC